MHFAAATALHRPVAPMTLTDCGNCLGSSLPSLSLSSLSNAFIRFIKSFLEILPFLSASIRSNTSITFGLCEGNDVLVYRNVCLLRKRRCHSVGCNNHCKQSNRSLQISWCHRKFSLSEVKTQGQLPGAITGVFCSLLGLQDSECSEVADIRRRRRIVGVVKHIGKRSFEAQP
jgi:hypothetical protein